MLNGLLELILKFFFWIASIISSIVFAPLIGLLSVVFPNFNEYLDTILTFWNRLLLGIAWGKEVFLNVTGFSRSLFIILVTYWYARFALMVTKRAIKFIANMYLFIRGSKTDGLVNDKG